MSETANKTLTVGYRRDIGGGTKFIIGLILIAATDLTKGDDGCYTFNDEDVEKHLEAPQEVRGRKNSSARLDKLIASNPGAVSLEDTEAIDAILSGEEAPSDGAPKASEPEAAPTTAPTTTATSDGGGDSSATGGSVSTGDKAKGKKAPAAKAAPAAKEEPVLEGDDKTLNDLGFNAQQRGRMDAGGKALVLQWGLKASEVSVMSNGAVRVFRSRLGDSHPMIVAEKADKDAKKAKVDAERAAKKAATAKEPTTYKVIVTHPDWAQPDPEGKTAEQKAGQQYLVGDNEDKEEAERVAALWEAAKDDNGKPFGFKATVVPDTRSKPKNNLWESPIERPCVSAIPGDLWVGDHLGPHLRALNLSFKEYCEEYKLDPETTPKCTNRARASLSKAHAAVRRTHAMRIGQMCVEVKGDDVATVFQISGAEGDGDETQYKLSIVVTNDPELKGKDAISLTHEVILERTKPINKWSASAKKGDGAT